MAETSRGTSKHLLSCYLVATSSHLVRTSLRPGLVVSDTILSSRPVTFGIVLLRALARHAPSYLLDCFVVQDPMVLPVLVILHLISSSGKGSDSCGGVILDLVHTKPSI